MISAFRKNVAINYKLQTNSTNHLGLFCNNSVFKVAMSSERIKSVESRGSCWTTYRYSVSAYVFKEPEVLWLIYISCDHWKLLTDSEAVNWVVKILSMDNTLTHISTTTTNKTHLVIFYFCSCNLLKYQNKTAYDYPETWFKQLILL